jgi:MFS family permease
MFSLAVGGVAIGLAFFLFRPSVCILDEYVPLYLSQIGYSASFIGLAPVLGLITQTVGIRLLGYLADKFRARRLFLFLSVFISIPSTLLFLAAETPEPICDESMANSTITNISMIVTSLNRTDNFTSLPSALPSFSMKTQSDNNGERLKLFFIFMVLRGIFELSKRLTVTLITGAAMTHLAG